jgi:tripartite motif-containing protein 71
VNRATRLVLLAVILAAASAMALLPSPGASQTPSPMPDRPWYTIDDSTTIGSFEHIGGVAVAAGGDLYAMDLSGHRILHYAADGSLLGSWGSLGSQEGRFDFSGQWIDREVAPGSTERLGYPAPLGVAVAPDGTVYVGDMANRRVQHFQPDGTFIASWPVPDRAVPTGGGPVDLDVGADGSLFVTQAGTNDVLHMSGAGSVLARWSAEGRCGAGTTIVQGIAVAPDGSVYVANAGEDARCVEHFSAAGDLLVTWRPQVTLVGQAAALTGPVGLAAAADGGVYAIVHGSDHAVHHFAADGRLLGTWGPSSPRYWDFTGQGAVALHGDGSIVIANPEARAIQRYEASGIMRSEIRSADVGAYGQFAEPVGMATGPDGTIYVADRGHDRIQRFTPDGVFLAEYGVTGGAPDVLDGPRDVAVAGDGTVHIADTGNDRVVTYSAGGRQVATWGRPGSGPGDLDQPSGIAVSADGTVYVSDTGNDRVQVYDRTGTFVAAWGGTGTGPGAFDGPVGIATAPDGSIRVADEGNHRIQVFDPTGALRHVLGWYGGGDGQFRMPGDVAVGADGATCATDAVNRSAVRFDTCGRALANVGQTDGGYDDYVARFAEPSGVTVGGDGSVYVSDRVRNRVQQFDASGQWVRLWGNVVGDFEFFSGEGALGGVEDMAVGPDGAIYLREPYPFGRIQRLSASGLYRGQWPLVDRPVRVLSAVDAMAIGGDGTLYALDGSGRSASVHTFRLDGTHLGQWPLAVVGQPRDIAVGADGSVYVLSADMGEGQRNRAQRYSADGTLLAEWGDWSRGNPWMIAAGPLGDVYVVVENQIERYTPDGQLLGRWGAPGTGDGQIPPADCASCLSISCIVAAPDGTVFVGDHATGRIQRFSREGVFLGVMRPGGDAGAAPGAAEVFAVGGDGTLHVLDTYRRRLSTFRAPAPGGWHAAYYPNRWLTRRPLAVTDLTEVDIAWGAAAPTAFLPEDGFSVRLSGSVAQGQREITVAARGGVRMWIGDHLVVDDWDGPSVDTTVRADVTTASVQVIVEYNDPGGEASLRVLVR